MIMWVHVVCVVVVLVALQSQVRSDCGLSHHSCPDGTCVNRDQPCPGQRCPYLYFECKNGDCIDGFSEDHCPPGMCNKTFERQCNDGTCVPKQDLVCKEDGCAPYEPVQCGDGTCLKQNVLCNEVEECNDGADEPWHCPYKRKRFMNKVKITVGVVTLLVLCIILCIICLWRRYLLTQKMKEFNLALANPAPSTPRISVPPPSISHKQPLRNSESAGGEINRLTSHPGYNRELEGIESAPITRESYNTRPFPVGEELRRYTPHSHSYPRIVDRPKPDMSNGHCPEPPPYEYCLRKGNMTPERRASLEKLMKSLEIDQ